MRETQRNGRILQVFNGREPYDHVVQKIIIEFFLVTGGGSGLLLYSCSHAGNGQQKEFGLSLGNFVEWDGKHGVGLDCWINTPVDIVCEPRMDSGGCRYEVHDF